MLTKEEKKLINYDRLPETLKDKIDAAFESPDFVVALTYSMQIRALSDEIINRPFTIRGEDVIVEVDGVKTVKEEPNSRQNVETAIKVLEKMDSLSEKLKSIQQNLTTEENDVLQKRVATTSDLKSVAFGKS